MSKTSPRCLTDNEINEAFKALKTEFEYQDNLPDSKNLRYDEAKDVPGFLTLLRHYLNKTEYDWAITPARQQDDDQWQVDEALNGLRKIAAIAIRGMIYNGIRERCND